MNNQRRNVLKSGSGAALLSVLAAAGIITPGVALADWNKAAFEAKSMADTLKALGAEHDLQALAPHPTISPMAMLQQPKGRARGNR